MHTSVIPTKHAINGKGFNASQVNKSCLPFPSVFFFGVNNGEARSQQIAEMKKQAEERETCEVEVSINLEFVDASNFRRCPLCFFQTASSNTKKWGWCEVKIISWELKAHLPVDGWEYDNYFLLVLEVKGTFFWTHLQSTFTGLGLLLFLFLSLVVLPLKEADPFGMAITSSHGHPIHV